MRGNASHRGTCDRGDRGCAYSSGCDCGQQTTRQHISDTGKANTKSSRHSSPQTHTLAPIKQYKKHRGDVRSLCGLKFMEFIYLSIYLTQERAAASSSEQQEGSGALTSAAARIATGMTDSAGSKICGEKV
jgi:hypothetical protein